MTLLSPSSPPSPSLSIPSDTHAMKMYNSALTDDLNHNLDPTKITHSLTRFGAKILSQSTSVWRINKKVSLSEERRTAGAKRQQQHQTL